MNNKPPSQPGPADTSAAEPAAADAQSRQRKLPPAAQRALAEAAERRAQREAEQAAQSARPAEHGGRGGPDPARYGDWEKDGIASDF